MSAQSQMSKQAGLCRVALAAEIVLPSLRRNGDDNHQLMPSCEGISLATPEVVELLLAAQSLASWASIRSGSAGFHRQIVREAEKPL